MLRKISGQLLCVSVAMLLSAGAAQAAADASEREMPATAHQIKTLNLNSGVKSNPRYQFSRKSADYAALLPVTRHQANVLKLHNVGMAGTGSSNEAHS